MSGWIKLHRQIVTSSKFADPDILRLWIMCLTKSAHKETVVVIDRQEIPLQPGQFVTGRYSLQQDYNAMLAPRKKVKDTTLWSWLQRLEKWGDLDINSTNKYSVITVLKWSDYQETLTTEPQQIDNKMTTELQQSDTNKNVKKDKNVNKVKKEVIKTLYGDHVLLTDEQYQKLINDLTEPDVTKLIDDINYWFTQKPLRIKDYKDHNLMIRKWHKNNTEKKLTVIGGGNDAKSQRSHAGYGKNFGNIQTTAISDDEMDELFGYGRKVSEV